MCAGKKGQYPPAHVGVPAPHPGAGVTTSLGGRTRADRIVNNVEDQQNKKGRDNEVANSRMGLGGIIPSSADPQTNRPGSAAPNGERCRPSAPLDNALKAAREALQINCRRTLVFRWWVEIVNPDQHGHGLFPL